MRILIADDEYLARSTIRSMLEDLALPLESVVEIADGQEMTALVCQCLPDVAFVDIRMPKLSGLDAIRACRELSPQTKWYLLTGFPEFEYAQEAIRLGVSGYLLKPVDPEELSRVIEDCLAEGEKKRIAQSEQFEHEIMALSHGLNSIDFAESGSFLLRARFLGALLYLDGRLPEKVKAEHELRLIRRLRGSMSRFLESENRLGLLILPGGELSIVGAWDPLVSGQGEASTYKYFRTVEQDICRPVTDDLQVTLLISHQCADYQELQANLDQLRSMADLRVLCGTGRKLDQAILAQQAESPVALELSRLALAVCRSFEEHQYLNYTKTLDALDAKLIKSSEHGWRFSRNALAEFIALCIGCQLERGQTDREWVAKLRNHGETLLRQTATDEAASANVIAQVTAFISENPDLNIGIGQIAERFNITPNYLSTMFHKKTGSTFMAYLKKVRMLRAKELLANPDVQIQQVAEQVGYVSSRHFARLFLEYFGQLPSEYRDRFKAR